MHHSSESEKVGDHHVHLVVFLLLMLLRDLLLGFVGEGVPLAHHPSLVVDVESDGGASLKSDHVGHVILKHSEGGSGGSRSGAGSLLRVGPVGVDGVHGDEAPDKGDNHVDHTTVHPDHEVDLSSDAEHGEELGDGSDAHEDHGEVIGALNEHLPVVGAERVARSVVSVGASVAESAESSVHGGRNSGHEENHLALHDLHVVHLHVVVMVHVAFAAHVPAGNRTGASLLCLAFRIVGNELAELGHLLLSCF